MKSTNENGECALVHCASHRARRRLIAALGYRPDSYWRPANEGGRGTSVYGVFGVPLDELPKARAVRGVAKVRDADGWRPCWR